MSLYPIFSPEPLPISLRLFCGLQQSAAWEAGFSVVYCTVSRSRCGFKYGIVEYAHYDDYKYALDYLDGKEIKTADGRTKTLRWIKAEQLAAVEAHVSENGLPKQEQDEPKTDYESRRETHSAVHSNTASGPPPPTHHGTAAGYPPHGPPPTMPPPNYYNTRNYPPPQSYGHGPDYRPPQ